jgi:hypothetical protein
LTYLCEKKEKFPRNKKLPDVKKKSGKDTFLSFGKEVGILK